MRRNATAKAWSSDRAGATALEHAIVAALLALAVVAGAKAAGPALKATFTTLSEAMGFGDEGSTRPRQRR